MEKKVDANEGEIKARGGPFQFKNKRLAQASEGRRGIGILTGSSGKLLSVADRKLLESDDTFNKEVLKKTYLGDPIGKEILPIDRARRIYLPVLKHPLPISLTRAEHETVLRRVLCCKPEKQAHAAVCLRDAWVLEEVYMRGAEVDLPDKSGFTPLHIACTLNCFEAIMVLLHIGVDINATSKGGATPLFIAKASNSTQSVLLLEEQGAEYYSSKDRRAPGANILDLVLPTCEGNVLNLVNEYVGMPDEHLTF
jgi:hypothetical protein